MKKLHLIPIAALGALMLTGCAKSGVETSPGSLSSIPASEQAIGFSTYTGRAVTKATDLNQSFSVEAFLSGADPRTLYFHPTAYTYASGSYTGDTVRYWPLDKTQNLDFYAVSPLKYTNTDSGEVDLKPSPVDTTITLTKTSGTTDVVAARVLNAPNGDTPAAVALTFGHKLTKVAFKAIGQDQTKKYVITGLTLTANSTSTYSYEKATEPVTAESWSASSDEYTYTYVSSDVTIAAGTSTSQAVGSAKFLIPNQASTLTATVKYKIFETSGGTDVCIGDNTAGISVSLPTESWGINRSVVYNLKLGVTASPTAAGKTITFTTDVTDWDTEAEIDTKPVTSITLSDPTLNLQVGGTSILTATVAPTDASIKGIFWSSDATGVATVDENGLVTAVGAGTATITATASDGSGVTGTCTVTVTTAADPNLLSGNFSVSDTKTVQFTKSNLWWDGSAFKFEENQTDYQTTWSTAHVSHFFWTKTAEASYVKDYDDGTCTDDDVPFFAESNGGLTVEGTEDLYVLTSAEWIYLIYSRTNASSLYKKGVTVTNGGTSYTNCLIIAPDDYSGTALDEITDWSLSNVNSLNLVCLPAAGSRDGSDLNDGGSIGYCWSATPSGDGENGAYYLFFDGSNVGPLIYERCDGYSVRLVYSAAPSAPQYPEAPDIPCVKIGDVWWAPVNCGYDATHTYGLLYQWGRKVGGGYDSSEGMQTATSATYDAAGNYTELDDTKFYTQSSYPCDWYTHISSQQLSAWPMTSSVAGYVEGKIANPCPSGWRVPTYDELNTLIGETGTSGLGSSGWDSTKKGYWFNGSTAPSVGDGLFLPAAGFRDCYDGNASNRGDNGSYWSSSVNGDYAWGLNFNDGFAGMGYDYRASGYSVRCVQE